LRLLFAFYVFSRLERRRLADLVFRHVDDDLLSVVLKLDVLPVHRDMLVANPEEPAYGEDDANNFALFVKQDVADATNFSFAGLVTFAPITLSPALARAAAH
jgi:hypothetical protein